MDEIRKGRDSMRRKQKHTDTPWIVNVWSTGRRTIERENGLVIAEVHTTHLQEERAGNADFIVKAVNCHDEMLEALKEMQTAFVVSMTILDQNGLCRKAASEFVNHGISIGSFGPKSDEIIAKAEGEK